MIGETKMVKINKNLRSLIAIALVTTTVFFSSTTTKIANAATTASNASTYGLTEKIQDGAILHAWNWSFNTIKSNLSAIADAGYTSIQVSPIQGTKENSMETSKWWVLYQPTNFYIGNAQLGSRSDFQAMCTEADKYGIKIIVDVVANHTGNRGGGTDQYWPANSVDPDLLNDASAWHEHRGVDNWSDRWQVTHLGIGLPDLNTSSYNVQNKIISYLNDCISAGADGFRFDAAKHIELPDDSGGSDFWTRVLGSLQNRSNLYIYGEVLQGGADRYSSYSQYINLAADSYGKTIRSAVGFSGTQSVSGLSNYSSAGVSADHLVTWVESHDTYANDSSESTNMNAWQIKMGWAMIAARAYSTPLYFDRPQGTAKLQGSMGTVGNDNWKDPDVIAVNKFRNAMAGEGEYLRQQSNDVMMIERGTKGAVIVNLAGSTSLNSNTNLANGTYTNKATTGGTFTVSNGKITGNLPAGITVLYNVTPISVDPTVSSSIEDSSFVDSLTLTLGTKNSTSATYSVNNGTATSYTDGQTITIGKDAAIGSRTTVTLTATDGIKTATKTYTYTKAAVPASSKVYFYNTNNWSNPTAYIYNDSTTTVKTVAAWPGVAMIKGTDGVYSYTVPAGFGDAKVIFNNNGSSQIPAQGLAGYTLTSGTSMEYNNGTWQIHQEPVVLPSVSISQADTTFVGSLNLTLGQANATTATYSINNGTATSYTNGQVITIGATSAIGDNITVTLTAINGTNTATKTYTYTKIEQPVVLSSKVYFYNTNNWSNPTAYIYNDSTSTVKTVAAWPGVAMTKGTDGVYSYTLPEGFGDAKVIFSNNGSSQVLAQGQAGYALTSGASMEYNNGTWQTHQEPVVLPTVSISQADTTFVGSLNLTLGQANATAATYSINNGTATSYTNGQVITIGATSAIGDNITVTLTATNGSNSATQTYTYTKIEQPVVVLSKVYFYNTNNWSSPKVYVYNDSTSTVKTVAAWPGVAMTLGTDGVYSYTLPEGFGDAKVIFSNNGNSQVPASGQAGYVLPSGTSMKYNNGTWSAY
jgi:alpha-amylase